MNIKEKWQQLSLREKQAVSLGAVVVTIFIFYQAIWKPALDHLASLRSKIISDQKTLAFMRAADNALQKSEKLSSVKNQNSSVPGLLSQLKNQINAAGLEQSLTQLKQSANERVEIHFQKVEFDKLMALLIKIMKENPVTISQLSVLAIDAPGFVNADIIIGK